MRGTVAQAKVVSVGKTSIQDEPSPALSTRRSKLLQSGNTARDSTLNDSASRQSSVSLDIYGLPFEDESDTARPAKRRRKEADDGLLESNLSKRRRSRVSPAQSSSASNSRETATKQTQIPGIEVSREKSDSRSPVSETASVLEPLPAIRQALRINFNAKGGGKLIISRTATPAQSVQGSARPSPAPGAENSETIDLEEVNAGKQAKKIPGRRRNPHKDPKIEAAIRRQAELKKCYRTIARAMKPVLVELSTRGINELEEDEEAHKKYPEYSQVMEALDRHYQKRQRELDAQLTYGLKLNEKRFKQDTEYLEQRFTDNLLELRERHAMKRVKSMRAVHRMNEYQADPNITEDDFDDELPPLRHADAYMLSVDDPNYNLGPQYESRSRQSILIAKAADHIGNLRQFDTKYKNYMKERNVRWDRKYGPLKSSRYVEPRYDTMAMAREQAGAAMQQDELGLAESSSSTTKHNLALLLDAIEQETQSSESKAHNDNAGIDTKPDVSFDSLLEAIRLREDPPSTAESVTTQVQQQSTIAAASPHSDTKPDLSSSGPSPAGKVNSLESVHCNQSPNEGVAISPPPRTLASSDHIATPSLNIEQVPIPETVTIDVPIEDSEASRIVSIEASSINGTLRGLSPEIKTETSAADSRNVLEKDSFNDFSIQSAVEIPAPKIMFNDMRVPQPEPTTTTITGHRPDNQFTLDTSAIRYAEQPEVTKVIGLPTEDGVAQDYGFRETLIPRIWAAEAEGLERDRAEARKYFDLQDRPDESNIS